MFLKQHRRPEIVSLSADLGMPENAQAALTKTSIRSHLASCIFNHGSKKYNARSIKTLKSSIPRNQSEPPAKYY